MHESSPLLPKQIDDVLKRKASFKTIQYESAHLAQLAFPTMLTYLLEYLPGLVSLILVGQMPVTDSNSPSENNHGADEYLDATALATMFLNLTALSLLFGIATALDTFASQAVGKAQQNNSESNAKVHYWLRIYLLTGVFVLSLACIPVVLVNTYAAKILIALNQPRVISILAQEFLFYLLPGVPFLFLYELGKKILQAKNIVTPMVFSAIIANFVNVVVGYYLVYYSSFGWLGAAVARTCCNVCFPLFLLPYYFQSGLMTDGEWDVAQAIKGMYEFFKLGLSGMLQVCFEWWAFEVLALLSGLLPNAVQAIGANAVLLNISAMTFMFYLGISVAGSVRIGNALGSGTAKRAWVSSVLCIVFGCLAAIVMAVFLVVFRTSLPKLFTTDPEIQKLTTEIMLVAALYQIPDAINASVTGALRGSGRQALGAKLNFVAYYIVGLPSAALLAIYFEYGVVGLWMGITLGLVFISIVGLTILYRTDWENLVQDAKKRLASVTSERLESSIIPLNENGAFHNDNL